MANPPVFESHRDLRVRSPKAMRGFLGAIASIALNCTINVHIALAIRDDICGNAWRACASTDENVKKRQKKCCFRVEIGRFTRTIGDFEFISVEICDLARKLHDLGERV
jgi:hypothetical protein